MDVTLPNGQVINGVPDGTTKAQLAQKLKANGMDVPQEWLPQSAPVQQDFAPDAPTRLERAGRGVQDVIDRISQMVIAGGEKLGRYPGPVQVKGAPPAQSLGDIATAQMNDERAQYDKGYKPSATYQTTDSEGKPIDKTKIDWMRGMGAAGTMAPLALIPGGQTALARAGMGAVAGGAGGLLQYDPTNTATGTAKNVALGAGTGAILSPVLGFAGDKLAQSAQWLTGKIRGALASKAPSGIVNEIPDIASLPPEAQQNLIKEAQDQISKTGTLNAEQLARKANLIAQGMTPTKSMVTRSPADWTLERNLQKLSQSPDEQLSGVGQTLTGIYQANDKALASKLQSLQSNLPKGSAEEQGMTVMKSLDDLAKASQKQVSKLYDKVRETQGDNLASDARSLFSVLDDLKDSPVADPVTQAATRRLTRLGMLDSEGNLTSKTLTVKEAEGLRQFINQQPNVFGKSQIIKAIDNDVLSGAGADAFKGARSAAAERFNMLDNPATQKALNTYGELMQGKTAQNFIKSQIINAPSQDVQTLVKTMNSDPASAQAIDALKSGLMQHLESKAINQNSGQFSGAAFNKEVQNLGTKLDIILGTPDANNVRNLAKAAIDATYSPPYSAVNNSNTAPMLLSLTQKARAIPGVPLIVNENIEKLAAQNGYRSQLNDALSAKAADIPAGMSPYLFNLLKSANMSTAPLSGAIVNGVGNQSNDNRKRKN